MLFHPAPRGVVQKRTEISTAHQEFIEMLKQVLHR